MKLSTRVKSVFVFALLAALLAGPAWADESSIVDAIIGYGLSRQNLETGTTITVEGDVNKDAGDVLNLGDISGYTINWKANLTVTGGFRPAGKPGMINFTNGTFNLTGGTIQMPSSGNNWVDAIKASGAATVNVSGGTITGTRATDTGINAENGTVNVSSGSVNIPNGNAIFANALTGSNGITGLAFVGNLSSSYTVTAYGTVTTTPASEVFYEEYTSGALPTAVNYAVSNGAVWNIEGVKSDLAYSSIYTIMTVKSGGTLNLKNGTDITFDEIIFESGVPVDIYGTLRIPVGKKLTNNGTINNYSGNTLDIQGTLTNNGIINNKSTGRIRNTGTIVNTSSGVINNNEGGVFQSTQTKEEMGGTITGEVQPIQGGGSGCDAGYGAVVLALAGFAALKRRKP